MDINYNYLVHTTGIKSTQVVITKGISCTSLLASYIAKC